MDEQAMKDALTYVTDPKNGAPDTVIDLGPRTPPYFPELSPREEEVALMLVRGLVCKEISTRLDIGVKTADTHRGACMKKLAHLGVDNTVKLCLLAMKRGVAL